MPKKILDEDRCLAFAQEQDIPVVEMMIRLMQGIVRRRQAGGEKTVADPALTVTTQPRPKKQRRAATQPKPGDTFDLGLAGDARAKPTDATPVPAGPAEPNSLIDSVRS